jgi:hypothetical protein
MAMDGAEYGVWVINRTYELYLGPKFDSVQARIQLAATGLQESRFMDRVQDGNGPAHSFWQMERGGGVHGVLTSDVTRTLAVELCATFNVEPNEAAVWAAIALPQNDCLACGLARYLYFADPSALPAVGDVDGSWRYYIRNWRPGKPKALTWPGYYAIAKENFDGCTSSTTTG